MSSDRLHKGSDSVWGQEQVIAFVDTDGDANVFRLAGDIVELDVNGKLYATGLSELKFGCSEGRQLLLRSLSSKRTISIALAEGQEEVALRLLALFTRRELAARASGKELAVEFIDEMDGDTKLVQLRSGVVELYINGCRLGRLSEACPCKPPGRGLLLKVAGAWQTVAVTLPVGQEHLVQQILGCFRARGPSDSGGEGLRVSGGGTSSGGEGRSVPSSSSSGPSLPAGAEGGSGRAEAALELAPAEAASDMAVPSSVSRGASDLTLSRCSSSTPRRHWMAAAPGSVLCTEDGRSEAGVQVVAGTSFTSQATKMEVVDGCGTAPAGLETANPHWKRHWLAKLGS